MNITFTSPGKARHQATVVFDDAAVSPIEEEVIRALGAEVKIEGFRPGNAPLEMLKAKIPEKRIQEETVHRLLPGAMQEILKDHELKPIMRPHVELREINPLTVVVTFIEQPEVKVKKAEKLKVPKEEKKEAKKDEKIDPQRQAYNERQERNQRESKALDLIAENTVVDLPEELLQEEVRDMVESQGKQLAQAGMSLEQWLESEKKTVEDFIKDLKPQAEKRLKIRFGVSWLIDKWKLEAHEDAMQKSVESFLSGLPQEYQEQFRPQYKPGERLYEQFKFQKLVEKVVERILS